MEVDIKKIVNTSPVVPVMVIKQLEDAVPLAKALVNGGLKVLEITLRTEVALEAIAKIKEEVPEAIVGAGTVNDVNSLQMSIEAGASFGVSPGVTQDLIEAIKIKSFPFLPGCVTPSEVLYLYQQGFEILKFFPAEAAGGVAMLKSIGGPIPQVKFCPTGGINPDNAPAYLGLKNVVCVGGSWMAPDKLIEQKKWSDIEVLARGAASLGNS